MTTPPPPWEAHPPLPDDEFGDVDRAPTTYGDPDEDTGPIAVLPPEAATMEIRTDRDLRAAEPTAYAVSPSEPTRFADPAVVDAAVAEAALHRQETAFARIPEAEPTQYAPPQYAPPPVPRPEDTYAGRFTAPLSVDPRSVPVKHKNSQAVIIAVAAVAAVALVALGVWWLWPSGDSDDASADPVPTSTPVIDSAGRDKLMGLLPAGYSSEACTAEEAPEGAVAVVNCTRNADAGGPASATYTLMTDADALDAAFERTVNAARVVNCPGRIQSPGPWRRNSSPQKVAGTLLCSTPEGLAQVAWTTDSTLLLNVTRADPDGPTLDQLFTWWQSHS